MTAEVQELITRLRGWGRRYGPRSAERTLMWGAADKLEEVMGSEDARVAERIASDGITADAVEEAMGGRKLLDWQRKALEGALKSQAGDG